MSTAGVKVRTIAEGRQVYDAQHDAMGHVAAGQTTHLVGAHAAALCCPQLLVDSSLLPLITIT